MHEIRTTYGFIIGSKGRGEADKVLSVFTRDFGLVTATALGIRLGKSKLRHHVQDYAFGEYSFVRGKEFWRLTDAQEGTLPDSNDSLELMARIASILRRLLHGEEAHGELFDCVWACKQFLDENNQINTEKLATLESLTVGRMLYWLGYMGDDKELDGCLRSVEITDELLEALNEKRAALNGHINKALRESQL